MTLDEIEKRCGDCKPGELIAFDPEIITDLVHQINQLKSAITDMRCEVEKAIYVLNHL